MSFLKVAYKRTTVEAPATKYTESKTVGFCGEHPGVPMWKTKRLGGCKLLNHICPLCEINFCRKIGDTDTASKQKEAGELEKLAKHYEKLNADFGGQSHDIEFLAGEMERIKSKLEKGANPSEFINMRRVNHAIEDAMEEMKKRFKEQEEAAATKEMFASDRVRALYDTIEEVKKTMVAFHGKSETATEATDEVLKDAVAGLNNLAAKLNDKTCEWGEDKKVVRDDLEMARAHIGSLQVDLKGAKLELSSEVREAVREFSLQSVLLEDRLHKVEVRVTANEAEIASLKNRVSVLEGAPQENRLEIESSKKQIESLKKQIVQLRQECVPVVRVEAVNVDPSPAPNTNEQAASPPSAVGSNAAQVPSSPTNQVTAQVPPATTNQVTAQVPPATTDQFTAQVPPATTNQVTAQVSSRPTDQVSSGRSSNKTQVSSATTDKVSFYGGSNTTRVPSSPASSSSLPSTPRGSSTTARRERRLTTTPVQRYSIENCHVRSSSSGLSKVASNVLEQIRKLQSNYQKESVVEEIMSSLSRCTVSYLNDSNANRNETFQESELAVIVEIMKREFPNNGNVQCNGCRSLAYLARANTIHEERIAHVGGIEA